MPNANTLSEKKKIVEELTEKLRCQAGVFVNYSGITVNEDTEMRVKMREANVDYTVIKNTLMRFAIKNVGLEGLEPILNGTTALAVSKDDPVAPARIIKEYADKLENYFEIKAGFMDGRILSADEVKALASIPSLPILQAQLLGTMLAPIASLAVVLNAIAEKGGVPVDAQLKDSTEEAAPVEAAAEQPAQAPVEEAAPAEAAAEQPAQSPVKEAAPTEVAAEQPAQAPAEETASTEVAAKTTKKAPAKKPAAAEAADEKAAEAPAEKAASAKTAAKKSTKTTAEKSSTAKVSAEVSADTSAEKPAPKKAASKPKAKATEEKAGTEEPAPDTKDE